MAFFTVCEYVCTVISDSILFSPLFLCGVFFIWFDLFWLVGAFLAL